MFYAIIGNARRLAFLGMLFLAPAASAQELRPFDMAQLPLGQINLEGGLYIATLIEDTTPFKSHMLMECQDCTIQTDAFVGLTESPQNARDFRVNPTGYMKVINDVCQTQADVCTFELANIGDLTGYAYVAEYADGFRIVEHVYYSNQLEYVINAAGPSTRVSNANVAILLDIVTPYVTGQKE